jgi:RNA polymerase sigma factor (sigma-70 family)
LTDRELLARHSSKGSEEAFEELVRRHAGAVYGVCLRVLGDAHAAEDATQAALLVLHRKARSLSTDEPLGSWLFAVARNCALNLRRIRRRRARHEREKAMESMSASGDVSSRKTGWDEVRPHLDEALASLPRRQRRVLVPHYLQGRSQGSIAEELGISQQAVSQRISTGLEALRRRLSRAGTGAGTGLGIATLAALLEEHALVEAPGNLVSSVLEICAGKAAATADALAVGEKVMKTMCLSKVKIGALIVAVSAVVGAGGGLTARGLLAAETPAFIEKLPVNKWVQTTERKTPAPYTYSRPVFVPGGRALYHWGLVGSTRSPKPAVMRRYDLGTGEWTVEAPQQQKSASVCNAVSWDSKRKRIVYCAMGRMLAYDPEKKTWTDMKAKTLLYGREWSGAPPVKGGGACYDPVNDEIVMFPHWSYMSKPKNVDRLEIDGRISGHLGTMIFSYKDNTWRRASKTIGPPEVRKARDAVLEMLAGASRALDAAWVARRRPKDAAMNPVQISAALAAAAAACGNTSAPASARAKLQEATGHLTAAASAAKSGNMVKVQNAGRDALWAVEAVLDGALRVEPPPRCGSPMVYHPETKSIYMFGGLSGQVRTDLGRRTGPGALNDTWVYACAKREWRELGCKAAPSARHLTAFYRPAFFYDPGSEQFLFVEMQLGNRRRGRKQVCRLWTLDPVAGQWSLRAEQPWPHELAMVHGMGSGGPKVYTPVYEIGYDPELRLLVFVQKARKAASETHLMRLDLDALPKKPVPQGTPEAPLKPQLIPPDDPAWVAKLKALPANTWVDAKPTGGGTSRRDWGNSACDPVRGHVYYFGGGHSTYQVADVAVYAVGANRWVHQAGDHNSFVPPNSWGGICMGFRGGMWAHHQRNQYVAVDGRMYVGPQQSEKVNPTGEMPGRNHSSRRAPGKPGPRNVWFYDLDRGGVWRQSRVPDANMKVQKGVDRVYDAVHMVDPGGRILAIFGPRGKGVTCARVFDPYRVSIEYRKAGGTVPPGNGESRAFTCVPDRDAIFYLTGSKGKPTRTWLYEVQKNTWKDLQATGAPVNGGRPSPVVRYIPGQDAVFAYMSGASRKPGTQCFYSFKRNAWTAVPHKGARVGFGSPYGQVEYVAKYGVLVACVGTKVMRPDASATEAD